MREDFSLNSSLLALPMLSLLCFAKKHGYNSTQLGTAIFPCLSCVSDICALPSHGGDCASYLPMWFYDRERGRCLQFVYTGCGGNANRFETAEECEGRCASSTPPDPRLHVTGLGERILAVQNLMTTSCRQCAVRIVNKMEEGRESQSVAR